MKKIEWGFIEQKVAITYAKKYFNFTYGNFFSRRCKSALLISLIAGVYSMPTQATTECYAVSDRGDRVFKYSSDTGIWANIGDAGVPDIEAVAYDPFNGKLYSADDEEFGEINVSTGAFSVLNDDLSTLKGGPLGDYDVTDIDGLSLDPFSGLLWVSERRFEHRSGGSYDEVPDDGKKDLIFKINPATNDIVADAFGVGVDYILADTVRDPNLSDSDVDNAAANDKRVWDVDDIAVDPTNGDVYMISNLGGNGGILTILEPADGSIRQVISSFTYQGTSVDDVEGLGFFNDGQLYGTTGESNDDDNLRDQLFSIEKTTGAMTLLAKIDPTNTYGDIEAVDCLTAGINTITGTVYLDADYSGGLVNTASGDVGTENVTVELYRDTDNDGTVNAGDILLETADTNAAGYYEISVASTGNFVLQIVTTDLPNTHAMTTDNIEVANFAGFGLVDPDNDFGHNAPSADPKGTLEVSKTVTGGTDSQSFSLQLDCSDNSFDDTTILLAHGENHTVSGIPEGTTCSVTEATPTAPVGFSYDAAVISPASVTIGNGTTVSINVSNPLVAAETDLQIQKVANVSSASSGDTVFYTITVTNNSAIDATGIRVTDQLPLSKVTYVGHTVSQGSYDPGTGLWTVGTVIANEAKTLTIEVTVN